MINNTLNYAKYQIKFIKKRILPFINNYQIIEINDYTKEIYINEYIPKIIGYLNNEEYVINSIGDITKNKMENWKKYFCETCNCELNGENEYNTHMKSNKHKKKKENLRKKTKNEMNINMNKIEEKINKINIDDIKE